MSNVPNVCKQNQQYECYIKVLRHIHVSGHRCHGFIKWDNESEETYKQFHQY